MTPAGAVIITGAGGLIGRATAVRLARADVPVLAVGRDEAALAQTVSAVGEAGGTAVAHPGDVTRSADVRGYVTAALDRFGAIAGLFNNAGAEGPVAPTAEYPEDAFDEVIAVNLRGAFLGLRHVLPVLLERGAGSVVNVGSLGSERGLPGSVAYAAAKHGIIGLTRTAAVEVAPAGVRVNAILPGLIDTRMFHSIADGLVGGPHDRAVAHLASRVPQGRIGSPDEVAAIAAFLLSDDTAYVNGAVWSVDGAVLASLGD